MLNFLYVYALWHLDARGLITPVQKFSVLVGLLALSFAAALLI